ncbi:MAG TPA: cupin domain-containing protein [Acidobacteriaceae bacterium]|nr:cupin domain-containing protein [Acidobacteriaceae bacterium]
MRGPKNAVRKRKPEKSKLASSKPRSYPAGFLTVGQTARVLGVSSSTLRVWENVGLVTPARSNGRFRLYTSEMLELLKRIKYLRDVKQIGVPGIKQMLDNHSPEVETNSTGGIAPRSDSRTGKNKERQEKPGRDKNAANKENLGERLRIMRKRCGIGIVEAAQKAGISGGFLSAIELSRANASVATLQRLAAAYGTTVLEFFDLPHRANRLVRPQDRRVLSTDSNVSMELLSFGTRMLQCMIFRVPPSSGSDGAYSHYGEEFIYMLEGTIEFWLDEMECHILKAGDSFWFDSNMGHRWFNASTEEAVLLWVNTPITF